MTTVYTVTVQRIISPSIYDMGQIKWLIDDGWVAKVDYWHERIDFTRTFNISEENLAEFVSWYNKHHLYSRVISIHLGN